MLSDSDSVLNVQHFDEPGAISSQAGEVTPFAEFPWRFLTSMLSELLHYRHLVLSVRVFSFVTITQFGFMLHPLCVLRVSFLVDVLSHEWHTNIVSSSSLGFIFKCALSVPFLVHTYLYQLYFFSF